MSFLFQEAHRSRLSSNARSESAKPEPQVVEDKVIDTDGNLKVRKTVRQPTSPRIIEKNSVIR